jgi:cell division transport system permease protein
MGRFGFFIREALRALRRNGAPSMAAIVTTIVTIVLLGVLIPIFQAAQAKNSNIRDQLSVRVAVFDDATNSEIQDLRGQLNAIPHVKSVQYIDKKEALDELKADLPKDSGDILQQLNSNPLPRNFIVKADDAQYLDSIREGICPPGPSGKPQCISSIIDTVFDRSQDRAKVEQVTGALKLVLTILTALLVIASLMLVGNTIRLSIYARRREVEVMRLVGATNWFIRWPFMIEGVVLGALGGLMAVLMLAVGKIALIDPLSKDFALIAAPQTISFVALALLLLAASVAVSAAGSGLSLRRFLRV